MILAAVAPVCLAVAIFFGSLRQRVPKLSATTKLYREAVAAGSREMRLSAPTVYVLLLLLAPLTVAALHTFADRDEAFVSGELR